MNKQTNKWQLWTTLISSPSMLLGCKTLENQFASSSIFHAKVLEPAKEPAIRPQDPIPVTTAIGTAYQGPQGIGERAQDAYTFPWDENPRTCQAAHTWSQLGSPSSTRWTIQCEKCTTRSMSRYITSHLPLCLNSKSWWCKYKLWMRRKK